MTGVETKESNTSTREKVKGEISGALRRLKEKIKSNNEQSVTKQPELLANGAVVFDYTNLGINREIVTRKDNSGKYSVRIKKWVNLPTGKEGRQTQKNGENETFSFSASNKLTFNRELGKALDIILGKDRERIPNTGGKVYDLLNTSSNQNNKEKINLKRTNLMKKPIDLKYKESNVEKEIGITYPRNKRSVEGRITRCLRFASITDTVEDRYGIPRGLLMALMAQEGCGDPAVVNKSGDGGAGLLHIQALNAADYGMKTLPRYTKREDEHNQIDYRHGKELVKAKKDTGDDLKLLSELDDRFNPVMGIDVSARFLMGDKGGRKAKTGNDWINVICRYGGRELSDYGYSVLVYWATINSVRGNEMPKFDDKNINEVITGNASALVNQTRENTKFCIDRTKKAVNNLNPRIDGETVSLDDYYKYLEGQWDNYGLQEYKDYNEEHPFIR